MYYCTAKPTTKTIKHMENLQKITPVKSAPQTFEGVKSLINYYSELGQEIIDKTPGLYRCEFSVTDIPLSIFTEVAEYTEKTLDRKADYCYNSLLIFAHKVGSNVSVLLYSEKCKRSNSATKVSDYEPILEEVAA